MAFKLTASDQEGTGGNFEPLSSGLHDATCFLFADIGTQNTRYGDKHQLILGFEVPGEKDSDGKPKRIFGYYNATLKTKKAKLRQHLESWRGGPFEEGEDLDFQVLVGHNAVLNILNYTNEAGHERSKIDGIMKRNSETSLPEPKELVYFDMENGNGIPPQMPEHIKKLIEQSPEWTAAFNSKVASVTGTEQQTQKDF